MPLPPAQRIWKRVQPLVTVLWGRGVQQSHCGRSRSGQHFGVTFPVHRGVVQQVGGLGHSMGGLFEDSCQVPWGLPKVSQPVHPSSEAVCLYAEPGGKEALQGPQDRTQLGPAYWEMEGMNRGRLPAEALLQPASAPHSTPTLSNVLILPMPWHSPQNSPPAPL